MPQFKVGDRVVHPAHQEGPAGTGTVREVTDKGACRVAFDTGIRYADGRHLERVTVSVFAESDLKPA